MEERIQSLEKEIAELKEQVSNQQEKMKALIVHSFGIAYLRLQQHLEHYEPNAIPKCGSSTDEE